MQVAEIELYEILKEKIGEKEAKTLVEYIEAKVEKKFQEKKDILATKLDIEELRTEMQKMKAEIIKWMFIFWAGQIGALIAILQIFFR
jgi:actin-related protein